MAVMDYGQVIQGQNSFIFEKTSKLHWSNQAKPKSQTKLSLEEEIIELRRRMENTVSEQNSFTSELVVQISTLLDEKINEYMKTDKKS